jgi:hypothetical protein
MQYLVQTKGGRPSRWRKIFRALPAVLFGALEFALSLLIYNRIEPINYDAAGWTTLVVCLLQFLVFSTVVGIVESYHRKTIASGVNAGFIMGLFAAVTTFCIYFLVFVIYISFFPPAPAPGSRLFISPSFIAAVVTSFVGFGGIVALAVSALGGAIGGFIGVVLERMRR